MKRTAKTTTVAAPAKTNLWLRVLGKRDDGYHAIETRMVPLSLTDELSVQLTTGKKLEFTCSDPALPTGEDNLVVKAVRAMETHLGRPLGLRIRLQKEIPTGAGLGGGSSDAAAVLMAINRLGDFSLNTETLVELAASLGSDVPFFIHGVPCDVGGRGELVTPLETEASPRLPIALIKPGFAISAAWAYRNLERAADFEVPSLVPQLTPWGEMTNDLERPVFLKYPLLNQMKDWLLAQPEVHAALLSGSGSTMLAILRYRDSGESLVKKAKAFFGPETWTYCGHTA